MKMPAIPLDNAKRIVGKARDWLASREPVIVEIPTTIERIGYAAGRKVGAALRTVKSVVA